MSDVSFDPRGSRTSGADFAQRLYSTYANSRAGNQLASGSYAQAANTLARAGNIDGYRNLTADATARRTAGRAEELALTKQVLTAARSARDAGQDVGAALAGYRQAFQALGTDPSKFDAVASQISANPALIDQLDTLTQEELKWELRAGGNGDTIAVRAPDRQGNTQSRVAYAAPRDPIVTPNAVITPPNRGLAEGQVALPGQAMPAPMAGPAISEQPLYTPQPSAPVSPAAFTPSAMVGITAQSESGNRERDANGNLITSPAGAQGRMQVMPGTNRDPGYGVTPARDNSDAERTRVGEEYLSAMMQEYGGDPAKAWAAYNWGPGNLNRAIQQYGGDWLNYAPAETQNYVANNLRALNGGGGEGPLAQGDSQQGPQVQTVPRVETTADGYRIERFTDPDDEWRAQRAQVEDRRWDITNRRAEETAARTNASVRTLTPAEVAAQGLPEGTVAQQQANGSINVVSRGGTERYTQDQRQSAGFAYRLQNAAGSLDRLAQSGTARPSAAILAFGDGRIRENALSSTDRRWLQAAREWLAPVLRKDTGAAVGPGELVTYMGIYLPSPTDDAATLAQKAQARRTAEEALRAQAGGAYNEMFPQAGGGQSNLVQAPGLRFGITPQQMATRQSVVASGGRPSQGLGTRQNPVYLNPTDPRGSYANVRPGQSYVAPDGTIREKSR